MHVDKEDAAGAVGAASGKGELCAEPRSVSVVVGQAVQVLSAGETMAGAGTVGPASKGMARSWSLSDRAGQRL